MNEHDAFYFVHIMFGDTEVYFYCFQEDEKLPNINPRKLKYQVRPGSNPGTVLYLCIVFQMCLMHALNLIRLSRGDKYAFNLKGDREWAFSLNVR